MLLLSGLLLAGALLTKALPAQEVFSSPAKYHDLDSAYPATSNSFSDWAKRSKAEFLEAVTKGGADQWVMVMGNEAADTDSMVSSLAYAYHLAHRKKNPEKTVALLQVKSKALKFRPENQLVMKQAGLRQIDQELLTLDQLPWTREKLSQMIKGIVLTDHNRPLSFWNNVPVLGLIDHHEDRGINRSASPRLIEMVGSATSLVAKLITDEHEDPRDLPMPLADIIFATISFDTNGLKKGKAKKVDHLSAKRVFPLTSFADGDMKKTSKKQKKILKQAEADVDHLNVTQLYARDYKGDVMYNSTSPILVGYVNVPYIIDDMIKKSGNQTFAGLAHESRAWIASNKIDLLVILTKAKDEEGDKIREILLLAKHGHRLSEEQAERVYHKVRDSLGNNSKLQLKVWHDEKEWGHQRFAWKQQGEGAGRKVVRPIVEQAIQEW